MPLVRISHAAGHDDAFSSALSQAVHRAMVATFNVPADDYFQIVTDHPRKVGIVTTAEFLGITHTDDVVFVQITCSEGRSLEMKKSLYRAIVDNIAAATTIRRDDVIINLVETKRENWSFGNGLAAYA
jgi:phenylpyruvate tautomerase PptA (4-oxalocrotonate tautomerase family)